MQPTRIDHPALDYAKANDLPVHEHHHVYRIHLDKGDVCLEVTVLKDRTILESFIVAYNTNTGEELYDSYYEHIPDRGEAAPESQHKLDAAVLAVVQSLHRNKVRIAEHEPLFRLFRRDFLGGPRLQYFNGKNWKDWDDVELPYS